MNGHKEVEKIKIRGNNSYFLRVDIEAIGHSLRLNAEVVARARQILCSLFLGVKILLHVVILFLCAL